MSELEKFFREGFADQLLTAGSAVTVTYKGKSTDVTAVVEQNRGNLQIELGGALYTADANVLLPDTFELNELISATVECKGVKYFITAAVKDPFGCCWNCALTRID